MESVGGRTGVRRELDERMKQDKIYVRSTLTREWVKIALDEDTKYWIFDDSCEPVGLTCDAKSEWVRIGQEEYDTAVQERHHAIIEMTDLNDATLSYFNKALLERVKGT